MMIKKAIVISVHLEDNKPGILGFEIESKMPMEVLKLTLEAVLICMEDKEKEQKKDHKITVVKMGLN